MKVLPMKILAVCIGRPEKLPGKSYRTGIFKTPVNASMMIDAAGVVGDAICNTKHHGGVDQAVYLEGSATLDWWANELGKPIAPGTFGENLVIEGLDNAAVSAGDRFQIGDVLLEVTSARIPCATFAAKMGDPAFVKRYTKAGRPGIYCRVLAGGMVGPNDAVDCQPFTGDRVTMPEMMRNFGKTLSDADSARYLAAPVHFKLRAALINGGAARWP